MSVQKLYTTGEMAKLCGVSVRTVQYYDTRNILVPSELSEGGRRLYTEEDVKKMKIICFLRDVGLSINSIGELFGDDEPADVISLLLEQQEQVLREELNDRKQKLETVEYLRRELKTVSHFSLESIGDIAYIMENRKKMYRIRAVMLSVGLTAEIMECGSFVYGICTGNWFPYLLFLPFLLAISAWLIRYYFTRVDYICPKCHTVFHPGFREMLFAAHTSTTRKLSCTACGHKGFCVETCRKEKSS